MGTDKFLEKTLRQNVLMKEIKYLNDKLLLVIKGRYTFLKIKTNGISWVAIQPKMDVGLVVLRKDRSKIEKTVGLNCAIFFESTSVYIKKKCRHIIIYEIHIKKRIIFCVFHILTPKLIYSKRVKNAFA